MESRAQVQSLSPSEQVVETVAAHAGTRPMDLPPLFDAIDPDALDTVVEGMAEVNLTFEYAGFSVRIDSGGRVEVDDPTTPTV